MINTCRPEEVMLQKSICSWKYSNIILNTIFGMIPKLWRYMPRAKRKKKSLDIHHNFMYFFLCAKPKGDCTFLLTFPTLFKFFILKNYFYKQKLFFMIIKVIFHFLLVKRLHQASFLAPASLWCPLRLLPLIPWAGHKSVSPSRLRTLWGKGLWPVHWGTPWVLRGWNRPAEMTKVNAGNEERYWKRAGVGEVHFYPPYPHKHR